jgi:hypothetical protein
MLAHQFYHLPLLSTPAVTTTQALVAALGDRLQMGSAARAEEEAAGHMEVAAGARSKARQYLVTAIKHMFLAAERNQQPVGEWLGSNLPVKVEGQTGVQFCLMTYDLQLPSCSGRMPQLSVSP